MDSHSNIIDILENGIYGGYGNISEVKQKIADFTCFFNSNARLALIQDQSECEELVFLLLNLKRNIKLALAELAKSHNKVSSSYTCRECSELIPIDPTKDIWTNLQSHEHFEELYYKFLNGINITSEPSDSSSEVMNSSDPEQLNDNTDSGIEHVETDNDYIDVSSLYENEDDVNGFRFNFQVCYDELIESKIHPGSIKKAIKKFNKGTNYFIQKSGPLKAVCLLCCRELIFRSKMSKIPLLEHVLGQRHIRCADMDVHQNILTIYHETWLNIEMPYQAHVVYFKPEINGDLKCMLCHMQVHHEYNQIKMHIHKDLHTRKVLDLFSKNDNKYYLVDIHIQAYNIDIDTIENQKQTLLGDKKITTKIKQTKLKNDKHETDAGPSSDSKELSHNIIKSVENNSSLNILEQLPNRFKGELMNLKVKDNKVNCKICKITLTTDVHVIKKHIRQTRHVTLSRISVQKYNYYCEICNIRLQDENDWDRHFTSGPNNHANMAESRKNRVTEYECTTCHTVIYGDELSLNRHLSVNIQGRKVKKVIKLPDKVKNIFSSKECIESECQKLTIEANDTLRYNQLTIDCCKRLATALSAIFPDCKAYPFGSRISGLGNENSDLDVFIDTGGMYNGTQNQDSLTQVQYVRRASNLLSKQRDEFQDVFQIPTARTPIVRVFHAKTQIDCDLSFRHGLSVENTKFLRFCLDIQPITQSFILLLKKWSEYNNLKEHMSNYALAIMGIFFLQIQNYLLSVRRIRELNPSKSVVINGWETISYTAPIEQMRTSVTLYPNSITQLLKEFFQYYANFPYATDVVCPLLGYCIKRDLFDGPPNRLPPEMMTYVNQLQSEEPEQFRALSPFCVQDPFDLSHNLTKAWQSGTLTKFKTLCELTYKHLALIK